MTDSIYYVYQYLTEDGIPYYVGKGKKNRINVDHKHVMVPPRDRRIVIQSELTNDEAKQLEKELITKYGRKIDGGILDNIKINQWACRAGWKHSTEAIEKISIGNTGKIRSEESKKKYAQPKTKEHAEKIRQANLGVVKSDETKKKISETKKGSIPWNKGIKGIPWSDARRKAQLNKASREL